MKIKALKGNFHNEDFYMRENYEMNLIAISEKYFFSMANDEGGPIFGYYQNINITPKEYEKLLELAKNKDRKKGITLLNLIHSKNLNLNKSPIHFQGEIPDYMKVSKQELLEKFKDSKFILQ